LVARRFHLREWRRPTEYGSKKATAEEKGVAEITKRFEALPTSSSHRPDSSTRVRGAATKTTPEKELTRQNCARSAAELPDWRSALQSRERMTDHRFDFITRTAVAPGCGYESGSRKKLSR